MGIVSYPELKTESLEDFLSAADTAMYLAKDDGGDKSQLYVFERNNSRYLLSKS
jgi:GGDEF domain-containing protein